MGQFYRLQFILFYLVIFIVGAPTVIFAARGDIAVTTEESKSNHKIFFEPTIGTWYGSSDVSHSYGAFGELTAWREQQSTGASAWSPGVDLFAVYSHGKSIDSSFKWDEKSIGGGPTLKYVSPQLKLPWQWDIKVRFLYTQTDGDNSETDYNMTQRDININPYTEYIKKVADDWLWGMTAEAKIAISKSIDSSWREESPTNHNYGSIALFSQHKFTDHVHGRLTVTGLYQSWDNKYGVELSPEVRLNETIMFGMKGAKMGGTSVITGFLRLEFGEPLRKLIKKKS